MHDLFSKAPEYTIDTSCLIEIFGDNSMFSKTYVPGLWDRVRQMIDEGMIISHIEVLKEIKPGDDLYQWAHANPHVFKDYAFPEEGNVIRDMSAKFKPFVNAKVKNVHADPWLIAQAKCLKLTLLTEETFCNSPDPDKSRIPNVCDDPAFGVLHLSLLELIKKYGWTFA